MLKAAVALGLLAASLTGAEPARAAPSVAATNVGSLVCEADRDPLPDGLAAELAARYPGRRFSAAVVDDPGCTYLLHPERRMTTASVLKIEVMVGVLLRAQREGRRLDGRAEERLRRRRGHRVAPQHRRLAVDPPTAPAGRSSCSATAGPPRARASPPWVQVPLGGLCSSGPTAAYAGTAAYDAACRGIDGQLHLRSWRDGSGWSGWQPLGGTITSDPDLASTGSGGAAQVVARGLDGGVWQYFPTASGWALQSLGGTCTSGPSLAFSGPAGPVVVAVRGIDGARWTSTQAGGSWSLARHG